MPVRPGRASAASEPRSEQIHAWHNEQKPPTAQRAGSPTA